MGLNQPESRQAIVEIGNIQDPLTALGAGGEPDLGRKPLKVGHG